MARRSYQDLVAWQKAVALVKGVYQATHSWPREELYLLTNQVRRAVISVPANIAEGQGRTGSQEFLHHLSIAMGSLYEVENHPFVARELQYLDGPLYESLMDHAAEVGRLLNGLIKRLRSPAN
jgi:four helix bundle protein